MKICFGILHRSENTTYDNSDHINTRQNQRNSREFHAYFHVITVYIQISI